MSLGIDRILFLRIVTRLSFGVHLKRIIEFCITIWQCHSGRSLLKLKNNAENKKDFSEMTAPLTLQNSMTAATSNRQPATSNKLPLTTPAF
jgi:hypothetical protein